ncbi:hypothetical protein NSA50_18445 [Clostridium sp. DSM 100503]|uniref:hypothetical protein n=1 Tax=Clostridium sp. DSM 100503 TaxID=2963282 RepID=UPI002149D5B5|nr:hypothetical protein [Clostridium sp. DSM 100503]MCR1952983.1 hypothetical protein [Clostridium sp. DSM 100503]
MNLEADIKICKEIEEQHRRMTSENIEGAFKLSQLAIGMYDRLTELRLAVSIADKKELGGYNKSDLKEYLRSKMKLMEYIHVQCRSLHVSARADKKFSRY